MLFRERRQMSDDIEREFRTSGAVLTTGPRRQRGIADAVRHEFQRSRAVAAAGIERRSDAAASVSRRFGREIISRSSASSVGVNALALASFVASTHRRDLFEATDGDLPEPRVVLSSPSGSARCRAAVPCFTPRDLFRVAEPAQWTQRLMPLGRSSSSPRPRSR